MRHNLFVPMWAALLLPLLFSCSSRIERIPMFPTGTATASVDTLRFAGTPDTLRFVVSSDADFWTFGPYYEEWFELKPTSGGKGDTEVTAVAFGEPEDEQHPLYATVSIQSMMWDVFAIITLIQEIHE